MRLAPLVLLIGLAAAGTAQAGRVDVSFAAVPRFSDAGSTPQEEQSNRQAIARYLRELGQRYLPAQEALKVEVLDIDLAGEPRIAPRVGHDLRVAKGLADIPQIKLRYTLEANGRALSNNEETVSDPDYARRLPESGGYEPLHFEKRMLRDWFRARFGANGNTP